MYVVVDSDVSDVVCKDKGAANGVAEEWDS